MKYFIMEKWPASDSSSFFCFSSPTHDVSTWLVRTLESMNLLPSETLDENRFSPLPLAAFARRDMYVTALRDSEVVDQGGIGNTRRCRIAGT